MNSEEDALDLTHLELFLDRSHFLDDPSVDLRVFAALEFDDRHG
jgi:hypothetical protein